MAHISSASKLQAIDGLTSFERAANQPLMLGLFLPHQQGIGRHPRRLVRRLGRLITMPL